MRTIELEEKVNIGTLQRYGAYVTFLHPAGEDFSIRLVVRLDDSPAENWDAVAAHIGKK